MNESTLLAHLPLPKKALAFDLEALYARLQTIPDHHKKRGVRYSLASLLMIGVLAKLTGQDSSRGMSHWARTANAGIASAFAAQTRADASLQYVEPHLGIWRRA